MQRRKLPHHNCSNQDSLGWTTKVQFPRFQTETNPRASLADRTLIARATSQQWLEPGLVDLVHTVVNLPGVHRDMQLQTKWWGEFHYASHHASRVVPLYSAAKQGSERFSGTFIKHYYGIDAQATPRTATEIVLSRLVPPAQHRQEVAALFIPDHAPAQQELVLAAGEDWRAPEEDETLVAQSLVLTIAQVALAELGNRHS